MCLRGTTVTVHGTESIVDGATSTIGIHDIASGRVCDS